MGLIRAIKATWSNSLKISIWWKNYGTWEKWYYNEKFRSNDESKIILETNLIKKFKTTKLKENKAWRIKACWKNLKWARQWY